MLCHFFGLNARARRGASQVVTMVFTLSLAGPGEKLAPMRPPSSLFGWYTMSSVLGILVIDFLFLVIALGILNKQDWYLHAVHFSSAFCVRSFQL